MTEGGVVHENIFCCDTCIKKVLLKDGVGCPWVHVVSTEQGKGLNAQFFKVVVNRWDRLLVRCCAGVEDELGGLFALVLHGVEQRNGRQFFNDRQDRLTRYRCPATEHHVHAFNLDQLTRFFREERPVRSWVNDDRFKLLTEQSTSFVLLVDHHQDRVFQGGLRDGHRAGKGMKNANFDGVVLSKGSVRRQRAHKRPCCNQELFHGSGFLLVFYYIFLNRRSRFGTLVKRSEQKVIQAARRWSSAESGTACCSKSDRQRNLKAHSAKRSAS